jgi:RNA polymerase sigma-70 factor (ECF subfamily)
MRFPATVMVSLRTDAAVDTVDVTARLLDEREFHALYTRTAAPLRAYVIRTLDGPTDADDIVQETFLRLLRKPVPVLNDDQMRAYVFRIASNLVVDHWRAHKRETTTGTVPERDAVEPDQGLRLDVRRIFARLKPRDRQIVWLAHVEGAGHREIAAAMGLRTGSVRVLLSRARQRLARLLRETGHATGRTR